jgi:hypothetical protein
VARWVISPAADGGWRVDYTHLRRRWCCGVAPCDVNHRDVLGWVVSKCRPTEFIIDRGVPLMLYPCEDDWFSGS